MEGGKIHLIKSSSVTKQKGGDLFQPPPWNQEPRTKIPGKVFWRILVPRVKGGDLTKSPPFFFFTRGDLIKSPPRNQEPRTKIPQKTVPGILVLGSWFLGGDLIKSPLVKKKKGGDLVKSPPFTRGTKILQNTFPGILVLGSWFLVHGGDLFQSTPSFFKEIYLNLPHVPGVLGSLGKI